MDLEPLVHRAQAGDVKAFVDLTRGYQHLAFGPRRPPTGSQSHFPPTEKEKLLVSQSRSSRSSGISSLLALRHDHAMAER
jgi:hypothetical protein